MRQVDVSLQIYCAWINMEQLSFARPRSRDQDFPTDTDESDRIFYEGQNNAAFKARIQHASYKVSLNLTFSNIFNSYKY